VLSRPTTALTPLTTISRFAHHSVAWSVAAIMSNNVVVLPLETGLSWKSAA